MPKEKTCYIYVWLIDYNEGYNKTNIDDDL